MAPIPLGRHARVCVRGLVSQGGRGGESWLLRRPLSRFFRLYEAACNLKTSLGDARSAGLRVWIKSELSAEQRRGGGLINLQTRVPQDEAALLGEECSATFRY